MEMNRELKKPFNAMDVYDDDDIPEIDLPKTSDVTSNVTPDEVPRRDGPGGE